MKQSRVLRLGIAVLIGMLLFVVIVYRCSDVNVRISSLEDNRELRPRDWTTGVPS